MTSPDRSKPRIRAVRNGNRVVCEGKATVLHSSAKAVNLLFPRRVITVLNHHGMLSPSSIVLDVASIPEIGEAEFEEGILVSDSFSVEPSEPVDLSVEGKLRSDCSNLRKELESALQPKDYSIMKALLAIKTGSLSAKGMERVVLEKEMGVLKAASTPEDLAKSLLGLGFGLTPSGDDFVLGMISFMNLKGSDTAEMGGIVSSYRNPFPRTILLNALDGQYPEPLRSFLKSIVNGSKLDEGIERLLKMGHTSGFDTLTGFLRAIELLEA